MASGLRCQAMVGLSVVVDAGGDGDQVGDAVSDDLGDPVVDLLCGLVVAPAEAVADSGERVFGRGQGAFAGVGDGGGLFGRPDVGDAQPVGGAGVVVGDVLLAQHACPHGAFVLGQPPVPCGAVVEPVQRGQPVGHVGGEPARPSRCRRAAAPRTAARRRRRRTACSGARTRSR